MTKSVAIGDDGQYVLGTSTEPRGTDLFVCIGHGGYDEQRGLWAPIPAGSMVCFYSGHGITLTNGDVQKLIAAPFGQAGVPIRSIAGGAAEIWDYTVTPFSPGEKVDSEGTKYDELDISIGYRDAWVEAMSQNGAPLNDILYMNVAMPTSNPGALKPVRMSEVLALVPGYMRYHWCACRSVSRQSGGLFRGWF